MNQRNSTFPVAILFNQLKMMKSPLVEMMLEKFQFLFLEAVCLIRSFIVQIVFPKNDLSEVSWWGIYGLRGRKTINCFCQMRTRAFPFLHLICPNQTGDTCCVETYCWDFCRVYFTNGGCANLRITSTRGARAAPENQLYFTFLNLLLRYNIQVISLCNLHQHSDSFSWKCISFQSWCNIDSFQVSRHLTNLQ